MGDTMRNVYIGQVEVCVCVCVCVCIGHVLRRKCLLQRVIRGKIKGGIGVTGRRRRRRRTLLDDLKERREYSQVKEEALDRTMWRALWKKLWICRKTDYSMIIWYVPVHTHACTYFNSSFGPHRHKICDQFYGTLKRRPNNMMSVMWGFHRSVNNILTLPGSYAA